MTLSRQWFYAGHLLVICQPSVTHGMPLVCRPFVVTSPTQSRKIVRTLHHLGQGNNTSETRETRLIFYAEVCAAINFISGM
jgi:hypothetical protein